MPDIQRIAEGNWKVFYNGKIYAMINDGRCWNLHYNHVQNPVLAREVLPEEVLDWLMEHAKN